MRGSRLWRLSLIGLLSVRGLVGCRFGYDFIDAIDEDDQNSLQRGGAGGEDPTATDMGSGGEASTFGGAGPDGGAGRTVSLIVSTDQDEEDEGATSQNPLGDGLSLREAILVANAEGGRHLISFAREYVISLKSSALPAIEDLTELEGPVTIEGVNLPSSSGCVVLKGANVSVRALTVQNCPADPIFVLDGNNNEVADCTLINTSHSLAVSGNGHRIVRNVIRNTGGSSIWCAATNTQIIDNLITDPVGAGITLTDSADNAQVVGNTVIRGGTAIDLQAQVGAVVAHNTIFSSSVGIAVNGATGLDLRNNILAGMTNFSIDFVSGSFSELDFNLYWNNQIGDCNGCMIGADAVEADPLFLDVAQNDLSLAEGSPAISKGVNIGYDRNGSLDGLFNGSAPDIGAYEFH